MEKVVKYVGLLSTVEKEAFKAFLVRSKEWRLLRAFDYLLENATIHKGQAYEAIFGKTYTSRQDSLLRNEWRNLTNGIKQWLGKQQFGKAFRENELVGFPFLLAHYLAQQDFTLFEKEWRRYLRNATRLAAYDKLAELHALYADYLKENRAIQPANYQEIDRHLSESLYYQSLHYKEQVRYLELQRSYVNRVQKAFIPSHELPPLMTTLSMDEDEGIIASYLKWRAMTYFQSGEEKIALLQQLLAIHPEVVLLRPTFKYDGCTFWGSIGLEYFLVGAYEQANEAYERALDEADKLKRPFDIRLYYNYVSNLFQLAYFEGVIYAIRKRETLIKKQESIRYRFEYLLAMSYIFMEEVKPAFQLIHKDINKRPESEYYNFRFVYAICFYMQDDVDAFEREITNINQKIRYQPPIEREYLILAKLFQQFLRWHFYVVDRVKKVAGFKKLLTQIELEDKTLPRFKDFILTRWLINAINQQLDHT